MRLTQWLGSAAALLCLGFLLCSAGPAFATPMPLLPVETPGPALFTPAYNYALHGVNAGNYATLSTVVDLGGTPLISLNGGLGNAFTSAGYSFSGTLFETVVQNDLSNPFYNGGISSIPGALSFIFTLTNNTSTYSNPDASISRLSLNGWAGFSIAATLAGSGTAGFEATRSSGATDGGAVLGVSFTNYTPAGGNPYPGTTQLNAGLTSTEIILNTNATNYTTSFASVIGGADTASNVGIFVPVPEPTSIALVLSGLGTLALVGWRRRASGRQA